MVVYSAYTGILTEQHYFIANEAGIMQWLANNWILVLVIVLILLMHLFGHGGRGNKGKKQ